jgi:hypothetical protein
MTADEVSQCEHLAADGGRRTRGVRTATLPRGTTVIEPTEHPEPLVTAYAAALKALRQLRPGADRPGVPAQIDQAHNALAVRAGVRGADVLSRLLTEIQACHQQGRAYSTELGLAFRAAYLLVASGPPRSWG